MDPFQSQHSTDPQGSNEDPVRQMDPSPSQPSADSYGTRDRPPGRNEDPVQPRDPPPSQPSRDVYGTLHSPVDVTENISRFRDEPSTSIRTSGNRDPARHIQTEPNLPQPPTHGMFSARHSPAIDRNMHRNPSQRSTEIPRNRGPSAEIPVFSPSQYLDSYYRPEFRQHWLENESAYVFKAFLPTGMNTRGFTKEIGNDGILLIKGMEYMKKPEEAKNDILGWKIMRSYLLGLDLRIKLPENVLPQAVSVELGTGVITVTLPKRSVPPSQIPFGKITIFKEPFLSL